ncbi:MAG: signal recognition particle protein [Pyrinomonadaceae bacterium]|nr:signal recognition particle protein [Pyrinomonadaceae bacterium]MCX7640351.1 signal recognition particle protein [Pyrinomonadaceae bacterium]MDW8304779.1 signal recognition particle protein [Acidobacteriota bacterium]
MFEALSEKIKKSLGSLRAGRQLTAEQVDAALREIRIALLEADVSYKVARDFVERIRQKAEGQEIWKGLKPYEQVVKIVYDELVELMGGASSRLIFTRQIPNVVMIVGLQGSGKTTSTGKIALWLKNNQERNPVVVSTDVYRPAAREQLKIVAEAVKVPFYETDSNEPLEIARNAVRYCQQLGYDTLLIDTAGRLHIDEDLMVELEKIKAETKPIEILFVADAMTGQDAVRSAEEFHRRIGITGVILTKMDGDSRGGAALSIKAVTNQPIKFVGVGEKYDAIEPFYPDRIAQRILGMGDILTLIEEVQTKLDEEEAAKQLEKIRRSQFTLDDFREQMRQFNKLGSMSKIIDLLPEQFFGGIKPKKEDLEKIEYQMKRAAAIIDSMTRQERQNYKIIDASRKNRIAKGSGTTISEVNQLLRQYEKTLQMMSKMKRSGLLGQLTDKFMGRFGGGLPHAFPFESEDNQEDSKSFAKKLKKKKRHKKKR